MADFPGQRALSRMTIAEIRRLVDEHGPDESIVESLRQDTRAGVHALADRMENALLRAEMLQARQEQLLKIERSIHADGIEIIAGVDEAGRGPLAGPVVAAAVILPADVDLAGLDDSKKLSATRREQLYERVTAQAVAWGVGMVDNVGIDDIGILEATMTAMRQAVDNLGVKPDIAIIDGNRAPELPYRTRAIVDGDAKSLSIAAASVIAKVWRDRLMAEMDAVYPGYGFARHKGYGAPPHVGAIHRYGPCPIHRLCFRLVPDTSPEGTVFASFNDRLANALTLDMLERAARGIARCRDSLKASELIKLRDIYRERRDRLDTSPSKTGSRGEEAGAQYILGHGYTIRERNWRAPDCRNEIDIIAEKDGTIVFIEVKTASTQAFGNPESWVTPRKVKRICRAAREYIMRSESAGMTFRFDVLSLEKKGDEFTVSHIENAFIEPEDL